MNLKIDEKYLPKVNSIMALLPQNPFVIDVIGKAIEISYANRDNKEIFENLLKNAVKVTEYVTKNSSPTMYRYSLIASLLLIGIEREKYASIDTASGTIHKYTELLSNFVYNTGWKDAWLKIHDIAKTDTDLLFVVLVFLTDMAETLIDKKEPTFEDKYCLAGLAYLEVSLRKSSITFPQRQFSLYNHFMNLLIKKAKF